MSKMCESDVISSAVSVKDLCFSYSSKSSDLILNGIDLTVPKATIYGLLGPSGCGKTTLLKCTLGRLKPKSGEIKIFGATPGSLVCHIPGAGVGYMPQELGLYLDFTVDEILTYFGRIFAMNRNEIKDKVYGLKELLQLPKKNKLIGKLSGGQQRRVSLACALIHCPPLLILDEPTVGTDPILRQTIWSHLLSLCKLGLTIILTTHYIEEARTADNVAFMRGGKILAEDNPNLLLNKYLKTNLEEVFLNLCHLESNENVIEMNDKTMKSVESDKKSTKIEMNGHKRTMSLYENHLNEELTNLNSNYSTDDNISNYDNSVKEEQSLVIESNICVETPNNIDNKVYIKITGDEKIIEDNSRSSKLSSYGNSLSSNCSQKLLPKTTIHVKNSCFSGRVSALLHKNFRRLSRNWAQLIFFLILPAIQLALLLISISGGPSELNLAVFNEELISNKSNNNWGQLFLNSIDNKTFNLVYFDSFESAYNSVESGHSWATIDINERFSTALRLRHFYGNDADEETIEESQIRVHIDWYNQAISVQIERYLYEAMMRFAEAVALQSNINPDTIKIPMVFEKPVYGKRDDSMRDFVLPGCYILLAFFSTASVTAHLILEERRDGLLERSLVAGITAFEFLLSHALTQFLILCFQITLMLLMPFVVFDRQFIGSLTLVIALSLSQGFCGIVFGLMTSAICSDIIYAAMFTIFMFFMSIIIGGVFWPLENMPTILRFISNLMPSTLPIQSMRSILFRGWNLWYTQVLLGFVVTYIWFAFFVIIALIVLRRSF